MGAQAASRGARRESRRAAGADPVLAGLASEAEFPRGSCMRGRNLGSGKASIRFPCAFGRDGAPSAAVFAVSFAQAHALARIKRGCTMPCR